MALGLLTGKPKNTAVTFVAHSDLSSTVDITLDPPSSSGTVTMTVVGNDRSTPGPDDLSHMGYVGYTEITGLKPFTQYSYTATNGTDTATGSFYTAPLAQSKFSLALITCNDLAASEAGRSSSWDFIEWYRTTQTEYPLVAVINPDDVNYADSWSSYSGSAKEWDSTGIFDVEYNWCISYSIMYGVTENLDAGPFSDMAANAKSVLRNVHFLPQAGDHEYRNNWWGLGDGTAPLYLNTLPNALHSAINGDYLGPARKAWDAFMAPLMGESLAVANPNSQHWECKLGSVQLLALDDISNVTIDGSGNVLTNLGNDQIDEILAAAQNTIPFKLLVVPAFSSRSLTDIYGASEYDTFYKTEAWIESEYNRLFRNTSNNSLMNSPYTNGTYGCFLKLRGDTHGGPVWHMKKPADTGLAAENYYEVHLCATNGGKGGSSNPSIKYGLQNTAIMEYAGGLLDHGLRHRVATIIEVDGAANPPQMTVRRYEYGWYGVAYPGGSPPTYDSVIDYRFAVGDRTGPNNEYICTFEKKFAPYQPGGSNLGMDVSTTPWAPAEAIIVSSDA